MTQVIKNYLQKGQKHPGNVNDYAELSTSLSGQLLPCSMLCIYDSWRQEGLSEHGMGVQEVDESDWLDQNYFELVFYNSSSLHAKATRTKGITWRKSVQSFFRISNNILYRK